MNPPTRTNPATEFQAASLFASYFPAAGSYDEMRLSGVDPRSHWATLVQALERMGPDELTTRSENGRRIICEHGVTYNVYADPQGMDRPWELDLVPLLIPPDEWRMVERGLAQRAQLFNMILADVYGPQRLLRDGLLPPSLVFANPAFLRPCHGVLTPGGVHLHLLGVDLARSPDGQWWVLADRAQAPSGAGYALENRIVLSRLLPDEFRDCQVERLAFFFSVFRDALHHLVPAAGPIPNVVLLTPGPYNETYFEHVYLARYLGFTLVEGGDLTVRNRQVFIKTLEGLQRVDVILRRVDDTFCDPLELRQDSFLGVPGLLEAARAGQVVIANSLGSGIMESPAFMPFLPGLCRHLLGEDLLLPSVATWWCGQAKEQNYVVDHLDEIVVKPALGGQRHVPLFGGLMDSTQRTDLIAAIRARPHLYAGQEQVRLSSAPVWNETGMSARKIALRAFVATDGCGYSVLPGGLTRVSTSPDDPIVSMQRGGGSKDTWVLSDGPVSAISLLTPAGQPTTANRIGAELPSRVADNFFWFGRYFERLEGLLRILRSVVSRMADESGGEGAPELAAMAQVMAGMNLLPARFLGRVPLKDLEAEILQRIYNQNRIGTVRELLLRLRHIAGIVRDRLSGDTWRILSELQGDSRTRPGRIPLANALTLLNTLIVDLSAFSGMEMENMTREHGWRFLDVGRRLERGLGLSRLVECALASEPWIGALAPILEIADSTLTYRRRYFAQPQLASVLELLTQDGRNPRALRFQLAAISEHIANFPRDARGVSPDNHRVEELLRRLDESIVHELAGAFENGRREPLANWIKFFGTELENYSVELGHRYFTHTEMRAS